MGHIVTQTNLYAQEYASHLLDTGLMGPHSRITRWKDVTLDELYVYFAIVLAMGVLVKSKMEEYWCRDGNIFSTPHFAAYMPLFRFQLINRCLHFNDNRLLMPDLLPKEAKLFKIKPIVTHLNSAFSKLFNLYQNVALDESLTQWKGWLNIKQYIPNKKSAVGIKTYEVCDSRTGYLWRFEVHTGAESPSTENDRIIVGSIPNLVLRLLDGLEHSGRTIWMDNYYNSPSLARVLKTLGLDCVGTLRTNRQFVPNEIVALKQGNMRVGQVCGCTSGDVDLMVWRDQNKVAMISTYHGVAVSDGKPTIVKDYNICMGGVDRKDQMLSTYPVERKRTMVWYKKFFKRLLNVSVLNAYIISKCFDESVDHRDFRTDLIKAILQKHSQPLQSVSVAPLLSLAGPKLSPEVIAHFPTWLPTLPNGFGRQKRQCAVCKKRTYQFCKQCNVALCFDPERDCCYIQYHS
ncbi:piggyBac transposable element-derived protein 4-like [Spodoptera litura]|nr:piggyBac transposable element-derived protein 4-like [Spodoptera litura]XP_022834993.1 piggyBac transposable element-derived protein 4-like [Spodoptera litura]